MATPMKTGTHTKMATGFNKGFLLHPDYEAHFASMTPHTCKKVVMAMFEYNRTGERPALGGEAGMAFSFLSANMDREAERYRKIVERNRANGKKGGRPRKPIKPSGFFGNPVEPRETPKSQ